MTGALADALLAARLLALAPRALGGLCLRGPAMARDRVLDELRAALPEDAPFRRLPGHIDNDRLVGGTDVAASLARGAVVLQRGLLDEVAGGVLVVPMAERLRPDLAGRVAQAIDGDRPFILVLLDDGEGDEDRPPAALLERIAFDLRLEGVTRVELDSTGAPRASGGTAIAAIDSAALTALAGAATALAIPSARPLLHAATAARAHAGLAGRDGVVAEDLELAVRLALAPRARALPQSPEPASEQPPEEAEPATDPAEGDSDQGTPPLPQERLIEAARAAIPADVLDGIAAARQRRATGGGAGRRTGSALRGQPLAPRPGLPGGGQRLALIDTLRAAIGWQPLRRREPAPAGAGPIRFRRDDLRIRRFEERAVTVTVFCVDASGSAAMARLAEAKGAVELILAQAYVRRSEVALVAFRAEGAELLLPPTRSLTRAKRALAALPGGGGTPLASGLGLARQVADAVAARGRTPMLVVLTDGSANVAADGTRGRARARSDALAAARTIAAAGRDAVVIDISPRPRPEAGELAAAMAARYLPLPFADAHALRAAVAAAAPDSAPRRRAGG